MTFDERGQLGGLEGAAFGVLVFAMGALVVAGAWGAIDAKMAASAAAREAARAYVEAPAADAALASAEGAARDAIAGHGRDPSAVMVALVAGSFARCQRVVFEARYPVRLGVVAARHAEIVDPYRSGLDGEARCDP